MSQPFGGPWFDAANNPLANGYLIIQLNQDAALSGSVNNQIYGGTIKVTLDAEGNFPNAVTLAPTTSMNPSSSVYVVSAYTAEGQLVWGPNTMTLN